MLLLPRGRREIGVPALLLLVLLLSRLAVVGTSLLVVWWLLLVVATTTTTTTTSSSSLLLLLLTVARRMARGRPTPTALRLMLRGRLVAIRCSWVIGAALIAGRGSPVLRRR